MTIHQITAPNDKTVSIVGSESDPARRCWIIFGTGYTSNEAVLAYGQRVGYDTTAVDRVPDEYTAQVARLEAYPVKFSGASVDGADPEAIYKRTAADGTTVVDIRDILNGTI